MPALLRHTASGHREIDGKKVESWYIVKPWYADFPGQKEQVRLFTAEEEAELTAIGHSDWYSWALTNWGTKWNACRAEIDDSGIEYGYIEITFETAWCAPEPVSRMMIKLFPKLKFDCRWRYGEDDPYPHSLDEYDDESALVRAPNGVEISLDP
jgi:hypothetical protein